ncbi:MAG: ubiquinol oxidase subunit II [Candidatus Saccharimonadales bacterium]
MKKYKIIIPIVLALIVVGLAGWYLHGHNVAVLAPRGEVGQKERHLMIIGLLLSVIVVVPTFALAIFIALRYREGNKKAKKYNPDWDRSKLFETIWWGVPLVIITILSVITWQSSHALDPFKPLTNGTKPLNVQVVALDWKWLFIYPDYHVASVNLLEMPINTPVNFEITSDTVMNSFWIPNLGSQIYAMPGMSTQLHLMSDRVGNYPGSSANISGKGFAGMNFTAKVTSDSDFQSWLLTAQKSPAVLDMETYSRLSSPSQNNPSAVYKAPQTGLYNDVVMKYMMPMSGMEM